MAFNKEKVMDAARKFVDKGQIDKAVKEYLRIVQEDPQDVRVWLKIGDLYARKGAKQEAIETYSKIARYYHDQGFFNKAIAVYERILKIDPRLVDINLKLAELYRQSGLISDAMQHFESVAAHFHREGNTKEALATVKKLVDLDPENIATRIKLAELYSKEGLVEDAGTEFAVACEQLRRQGRQDDFVKVAERLLWHKPENHALNRELAGLYLRRNDPRRALQKLQACFKADSRDVDTLGLLAQAFQALDQKTKTVSVLKELARIHQENKARDKATEVFRKILEFSPADPDAVKFLGLDKAPQPRAPTPMPVSPADAHNFNQKLNITSDLPSVQPSARMTGSMPLVDEASLSGVDFALPEYDDADFSQDMEPSPDARSSSAAGERHAEEIAKILAETDVYVKYGLHQKAVDHLRRVFALDPDNIEAHERLKDIFLSQGREQEAEAELLKLADLVAPSDPDRAEAYLRDLLAINGTHTGAFELARRHRLRVARMASEHSYRGGALAEVEPDDNNATAYAPAPRRPRTDSVDDFDPNDLIGSGVAHGSPAPARPPGPPGASIGRAVIPGPPPGPAPETAEFELDYEPSPSQATRQLSPAEAAFLSRSAADEPDDLDDGLIVDRPPPISSPVWRTPAHDAGPTAIAKAPSRHPPRPAAQIVNTPPPALRTPAPASRTPAPGSRTPSPWTPSLDDAVEAQLDDAALGQDIDQEVAAELGASDLPFDRAEARAFDAGVVKARSTSHPTGYEQTDLPARGPAAPRTPAAPPARDPGRDLADSGSFDEPGGEYTSEGLPANTVYDPYASQTPSYGFDVGQRTAGPHAGGDVGEIGVDTAMLDDLDDAPSEAADPSDPIAPAPRGENSFENDLDEADFYLGQGMYAEAHDALHAMLLRYPNNKLILTKLREVEGSMIAPDPLAAGALMDVELGVDGLDDHDLHAGHHAGHVDDGLDEPMTEASPAIEGTDAIDLDEIEELADADDEDDVPVRRPAKAKGPAVMLENPVDEGDAETHYDLGLAYKEMGLYDEAIKAFEKVLRAPQREVQCRLMLGMCQREQGNGGEAVTQFKQGLHADTVSDRERQSLYYEIGLTYESMGDDSEALYYFEMVLKRDPNFADAGERADGLRGRVGRGNRRDD